MNLLPLGTVIKINDSKAFIIGYASVNKENVKADGYFVVSYPLGFTSIEKVVFVRHDYPFTVLAKGFHTEKSEKLLSVIAKSLEVAKDVSIEELEKFNEHLKEVISSKKEDETK